MRDISEQHLDHSGGVQSATTWPLRAANEVEDVTNGRFDDEIGRINRRLGIAKSGDAIQTDKPGLGLYEAKFSTGSKIFVATNNSGDTATIIKTRSGTSYSALTVPTALPASTEVNMAESIDEAYYAGISATGARIQPVNVKNDLTTSETRNLIGCPKARFITEYGGRLYVMNVELDGTVYRDRAYQSSPALSVVTYTRGIQNTLADRKVYADSVRYLKTGMAIDIYNHVTGVVRYSNVTIGVVDKPEDSFVLPALAGNSTYTVVAATDLFTTPGTAPATGTPITVTTTTSLAAPLLVDTVYYVINVSGTTFKLATTAANATAGTAIDITTTGSGTQTFNLSYILGDNDEIYLTGRKGQLCYLWNTDYPSIDTADFLKIPSGASNNSEIVGFNKTNSRLLLFTDTTTHRWDQSQLITKFEDIGCANHQTIQNIGDWTLWLDNDKRVIGYNDATGQQEFISRAVKKKYLKDVPTANLATAAAGKFDNTYKLCLGQVDGKTLRISYDFDSNNWTRDEQTREMRRHVISRMSGDKRLYFLADNGYLYLDDEGDLDDGEEIPLRIKFGRNRSGSLGSKTYIGMYLFGENLSGGQVRCYLNGYPDPIDLGKTDDNISVIDFGQREIAGRDINIEFNHTGVGSPVAVDGYELYGSTQEDGFGGK